MFISNCAFISVLLTIADGFTLRGPSAPLAASLGSSVVLPCSVDEPLPVKDLEVEWRRTDSDTLVHLYQDGESRAESQHQDYQDRVHFFTEEIQHGNFSLRLDKLRAGDQGKYTCTVYSQQESGETVVQIKDVERLLVSGSSRSISASVGEDVTLNCSVESHITAENLEEVSWKKTDKNNNILVLVFQNNETLPESSDARYRDRVEFFTDEIPKLNFSLRLKSVRTEDKGVYMCEVFAGDLSANTTVIMEQMGFSVSHILVLILCVSASGSALLLCCLIYCRNQHDALLLQMSLVICPNILLFIAFVLWGVIEGSLNETVACCTLYCLRPLMLCSAAPYKRRFTGNIALLMVEYFLFSTVVYSGFFIVAVLPLMTTVTRYDWDETCGIKMGCSPLVRRSVWLMLMLLINAFMVYFYIMALENEKDGVGWACVIGFLQFLWTVWIFRRSFDDEDMSTCVPVYVFGSVVVVLLNAAALMTELILKTVDGEGAVGDLRIVVFYLC